MIAAFMAQVVFIHTDLLYIVQIWSQMDMNYDGIIPAWGLFLLRQKTTKNTLKIKESPMMVHTRDQVSE